MNALEPLGAGGWPPGQVVPVDEASRVGEARRAAAGLAYALGFADTDAARVALVATELATNLVRHAVGGQLVVQAAEGPAVELLAVDRGPGIADVRRAMRDGYSSGGTSGTGLGAVRRQADAVDLYTRPSVFGAAPVDGEGTVAWARCARHRRAGEPGPGAAVEATAAVANVAGVCLPVEGEQACGDAWAAAVAGATRMQLLVVDGLGHGPAAAAAAAAAVETFRAHAAALAPAALVEQLHGALRATRGAALAVALFDGARREIRFAGIGNVAGAVYTREAADLGRWGAAHMMSHNGTVGHQMRKVQELVYAWPVDSFVIFHTDGVRSRWQLDAYPGIGARCPAVVAGVLWRDQRRGRDDATVVVVGDAAPAR